MRTRKMRSVEKKTKGLFNSESAASTVIAAVMLLAIVLTLFAVVRIAYVPEWKNDAEQMHIREVQKDMGDLKSTVDMITLLRSSNLNLLSSNSFVTPPSTTVQIHMGGGEVPIVAPSRSSGMLSVNMDPCIIRLVTFNVSGSSHTETVECGGITYGSNNEQYVDQILRYENGGLILTQGDISLMRQPPLFAINRTSEGGEDDTINYSVSIQIINVTGNPESFSSETDTSLRVTASDFTQLNNGDDSESIDHFSYTVFTNYPNAWYSYFNETAKDAGIDYITDYTIEETVSNDSSLHSVTFNFKHANDTHLDNLYVNKSVVNVGYGTGSGSFSTSRGSARQPPISGFSFDPSNGCVPVDIQITDNSQYAKNYSYDFGDGTPKVTYAAPKHTYTKSGTFNITQTVGNRHGTANTNKSVTLRHVPIASFTSDVTQGDVPLTVIFTDTSQYATNISWDFGDGYNSNEKNPTHEYTVFGIYNVTLTANNGFETNTTTGTIKAVEMPTARFSASAVSGVAPLKVQFKDLSTKVKTWYWEFGDGITSDKQNSEHTYTVAGIYRVNLTTSNEFGQVTTKKTITVKSVPVASFTFSPTNGKAPLTVQFTDTSTNSPTLWDWDFGDNTGDSYEKNPTHTYTKKGTYPITLEAGNDVGTVATDDSITIT